MKITNNNRIELSYQQRIKIESQRGSAPDIAKAKRKDEERKGTGLKRNQRKINDGLDHQSAAAADKES